MITQQTTALSMALPVNSDHLNQYHPVEDLDGTTKVWISSNKSFTMHAKQEKIYTIQIRCLNRNQNFYDYLEQKGKTYIRIQNQKGNIQKLNDTQQKCKTRHTPILIMDT